MKAEGGRRKAEGRIIRSYSILHPSSLIPHPSFLILHPSSLIPHLAMIQQLSERAKELTPKARIISFATWQDKYSPEVIQALQAADDEGRYLTDGDLAQLAAEAKPSPGIEAARFLRDSADEIVAEARAKVIAQYPGITEEGGDLYPPLRAESCWRDFWHFLRCTTYGIAGQINEFTSSEGLHYMELLYRELRVPLPAMVTGLEYLKAESITRATQPQEAIAPYFDRLLDGLKQFKATV